MALAVALWAASARADGPPAGEEAKAAAQTHLDRGNELFTHERFEEALAEFQAANALYPSAHLEFNMGQCERALGHGAAASEHFRRFLDGGEEIPPELRAEALGYLDELARPAPTAPPAPPAAPPSSPPPLLRASAPPPPPSLARRWWFWAAIGAVTAGAAVGIVLYARRPQDPVCTLKDCY